MDCISCKEKQKNLEPVPYIAHESAIARYERANKRLIAALLVVVVLWFATIGIAFWLFGQYDYEEYSEQYEYQQDGGLNIIGDSNEVGYEPETKN